MDMFIDAEGCIAGRLASITAKELLKGKTIYIVNAEKALLTGNPKYTINKMKEKVDRGDPYHGPFYPRRPDQIIKRFVRGMLPDKPRGKEAMKKLRIYLSVPDELKEKEFTKPSGAVKSLSSKHINLGKVAEKLGSKKTW
jgi:large subunit ribosomal protein L13